MNKTQVAASAAATRRRCRETDDVSLDFVNRKCVGGSSKEPSKYMLAKKKKYMLEKKIHVSNHV